jgi:hypothetical protein
MLAPRVQLFLIVLLSTLAAFVMGGDPWGP